MQQIALQPEEKAMPIPSVLEPQVQHITKELKNLVAKGDWGVVKSVLRVLDAHARAHALCEQGHAARAHLWLVGISRKPGHSQIKTLLPAELA